MPVCLFVCLSVCLLARCLKKLWKDFDEILYMGHFTVNCTIRDGQLLKNEYLYNLLNFSQEVGQHSIL